MTDLVATLKAAGFKGQALKTAWAIASRESGGRARAYNPDRSTGDDSYGLFQINMLGGLGPSRRKQYGLKSNEDLYDPATNARVAFAMSKGGKDFGAWGVGPNAYRKTAPLDLSGFPGGGGGVTPARGRGGFKLPDFSFDLSDADALPSSGMGIDIAPPLGAIQFSPPPGFVRSKAPKVPAPPKGEASFAPVNMVVEGSNIGAQAVRKAATQLGDPYLFGSTSVGGDPKSFDCSSLVQWSYKQLGIDIPRDTWGQQRALPLKSWAQLQPGDPIYRKSGGHVVIYAGNGKVIAAPHTGTVVQYQPLSNFPPGDWEVRSISR